jgi:hypothetical protein
MYLDKLDVRITQEFLDKHSGTWRREQYDLRSKIQDTQKATPAPIDQAVDCPTVAGSGFPRNLTPYGFELRFTAVSYDSATTDSLSGHKDRCRLLQLGRAGDENVIFQ